MGKGMLMPKEISNLLKDDNGRFYRMVAGDKIYQIEEKTKAEIDLNRAINEYRAQKKLDQNQSCACDHKKVYYCMVTGGSRCRKCKKIV